MRQDTALVMVDMQDLSVDIGGEDVLAAVNEQVVRACEQGWPVYYTQDVAPNDLPDDPALDLHPKTRRTRNGRTEGAG